LWSADKEREPVPVTSNAERPVPDARRQSLRLAALWNAGY